MRLCHLLDVPDGGARGFDTQSIRRASVFIVRRGQQVRAWLDACPHHGTPLPWRKDAYFDAAGANVVCAAHGALFDPWTGICTLGPCLGDALTRLPTQIDSEGGIHLTVDNNLQETDS
ncbi:Rieske (2Fe-2S) protein [Variovorax robiniae]|uniref:Rieske (2Fe-2S) protein n=1 Tax=Variovorax robiniae TaxID=1836199 RepID=A0ABU8X0G9_9BURK